MCSGIVAGYQYFQNLQQRVLFWICTKFPINSNTSYLKNEMETDYDTKLHYFRYQNPVFI